MNFSGYFLLASAAILVAAAQQSALNNGNQRVSDTIQVIQDSSQTNLDANIFVAATLVLREEYINGTIVLGEAEDFILDGISAAETLIVLSPEAARTALDLTFEQARIGLLQAGLPGYKAVGQALGLSNEGARQGLDAASQLIQRAGIAAVDALNAAKALLDHGYTAGGNANQELLNAVRFGIETGIAAAFRNIQLSIQRADQALRDAQTTPTGEEQVNGPNCDAAASDPQGSVALNSVNESANVALLRGANAAVVESVRRALECSIGDVAIIGVKGKGTVASIKTLAETDPLAAKTAFFKQAASNKDLFHDTSARNYLALGDAAIKSGNQSSQEIDEAVLALEKGKIEAFAGIDAGGDLLVIGINFGGEALSLAATKSGFFSRVAYLQGIVKAANLVFSVL